MYLGEAEDERTRADLAMIIEEVLANRSGYSPRDGLIFVGRNPDVQK